MTMRTLIALLALCLALPVAAARPKAAAKPGVPAFRDLEGGLRVADLKPGKGEGARTGQVLKVLYRGWIFDQEKGRQGRLFDQHLDARHPFAFTLGKSKVIRGWQEGLAGMRVGAKRVLVIPPALAYGDKGARNDRGREVIPPGAALIFEVQLLGLAEAP